MSEGDAGLAVRLAREAGERLCGIRGSGASDLGRRGDKESNAFLLAELNAWRPYDAVLSEEAVDDPARLEANRVWIIDPLDGTREYAMPGRTDWAVHVALWQRDRGITAAAVALPALGLVYGTDAVVPEPGPTPPRILVSDSRPPAFAEAVAASVGATLTPMGSAGAKAMAVLRGEAEAYVHAGGQWEWDSAAPVGVALAAGLHASRVDGSPLEYNQRHPYLPDLIICRKDAARQLLAAIGHGPTHT
jgi:3'(2'), 5'-bisphosphate nucleotidase